MSTPSPQLCAVLTVLRAFPCRSRLGDVDTAATMEEEVRRGRTGRAFWVGAAGVGAAVLATVSCRLAQGQISASVQMNVCELPSLGL